MKVINTDKTAKLTRDANAVFLEKRLSLIKGMIEPYIPIELLNEINVNLKAQKLSEITVEDVARVAYVHSRSIHENDGYSPYDRITEYAKKNEISYNTLHIKVATELLLEMEFIILEADSDKKKRKCRRYRFGDGIKEQLLAKVN